MVSIEEGKYYRTVDGRILGPYSHFTGGLWAVGDDSDSVRFQDGRLKLNHSSPCDLVAEWPIRTVKQIVPGTYGPLIVHRAGDTSVSVSFEKMPSSSESGTILDTDDIRNVIATLSAIADVLEGK